MFASAIISKKRDQEVLTREEIEFMIHGLTNGTIPDYQMAAWAMAVLCRGMNDVEVTALTDCMLNSGGRLERVTDRPRVDKHSTGGLGDKVSLVLAPLLACFDVDVPMLSGRGLGITGGTLDKLESFAGFRCDLTETEIATQLQKIGCVITGTTESIAPADRKLYALRDVTGTVPSIALITASIMSKKLAGTLDALVLDVKWGSGAFMRSAPEARKLMRSLITIGSKMGLPTQAVLTDMNQPLGRMVGNACEVNEAIEILEGAGPDDVRTLTLELCSELLFAVGKFAKRAEAIPELAAALDDGRALNRFQQLVEHQGGEFSTRLPLANGNVINAPKDGFLTAVYGPYLGEAIIQLGGGRRAQGDQIDHRVGIEMLAHIGDRMTAGRPLMRVFSDAPKEQYSEVKAQLLRAITISDKAVAPLPLFVR